MGTITLASISMSREGAVFRYVGMAEECSECGLKEICHKLSPGRFYKVTKVRDVIHPCKVHDGDQVKVVEVEEMPLEMSIPQRKALEGALISLDEEDCPNTWCDNHFLCAVPDDIKGKKVAVKEVKELLECPRGLKLLRSIVESR